MFEVSLLEGFVLLLVVGAILWFFLSSGSVHLWIGKNEEFVDPNEQIGLAVFHQQLQLFNETRVLLSKICGNLFESNSIPAAYESYEVLSDACYHMCADLKVPPALIPTSVYDEIEGLYDILKEDWDEADNLVTPEEEDFHIDKVDTLLQQRGKEQREAILKQSEEVINAFRKYFKETYDLELDTFVIEG